MPNDDLTRRDFNKLTLAALGGAVAGGALAGCSQEGGSGDETELASGNASETDTILMSEPHVCRGLNTCKNMGAAKDNECAGMGTCASAEQQSCGGRNECKGQGGCGETPGQNTCSAKGDCSVPLNDKAWAKARDSFEAAMSKAGKKFGDAPTKG
jgi:hypothetical protein